MAATRRIYLSKELCDVAERISNLENDVFTTNGTMPTKHIRRTRARAGFRSTSIARAYPDFESEKSQLQKKNVIRSASIAAVDSSTTSANGEFYRRRKAGSLSFVPNDNDRTSYTVAENELRSRMNSDPPAPTASLLKYEIRKCSNPKGKVLERVASINGEDSVPLRINSTQDIKAAQNIKATQDIKANEMSSRSSCLRCRHYQGQIKDFEKQLAEQESSTKKVEQYENDINSLNDAKSKIDKELKKAQRELRKVEKTLEEEEISNRRLTIKLEDANYEIQRLRQELIQSQLENEKLVEENEDMAVDNEDLIKERDEIIGIYDELSRECERLKMEVGIWKGVFENNKANFPEIESMDGRRNENNYESSSESEDEGIEMEIEEDQSLLLPPRNDVQIKTSDLSQCFEVQEEIGRGKFGKVYKAVARSTGDIYVAKYIKVTAKLRQDVLDTIEVMKKLHHTRIVNIFDVYDMGSQIVQILEYAGGGGLFERIVEKNSLTEADCIMYVKQILQALYHLHSKNICHLDLKPENIICVSRQTMDIKLIDFGLAKQLQHKKEIKITAGTPEFVAPEILSFDPVSLASDMWSVGVITYVLLSGVSPFLGDDDNDTLMNVSCGEYEYDDTIFGKISTEAVDFIDGCLVSQAKKRASVSSCLRHSWMKGQLQGKKTYIDLSHMKEFLEKRKEKRSVNSVRAIRRFSSFGVGMRPSANPQNLRAPSPGPSRQLTVPNALQAATISEADEDNLDEQVQEFNRGRRGGPVFTLTRDSCDSQKSINLMSGKSSRAESFENLVQVPEDTSTPDGLRKYLERMISEGNLPGTRGSGPVNFQDSDEE